MNKLYFLHILFLILLLLLFTRFVESASGMNQLLAYFCLHAVAIVLIASELKRGDSVFDIKIVSLIIISFAIILRSTYSIYSGSQLTMLLIMFFLNNIFLILGTTWFKSINKNGLQGFSIFRSLAISLNILFMYFNISSPSNIFFTKWWLLGGIFYIPYIDSFGPSFWISTIFISVSIIYLSANYKRISGADNGIVE